MGGWPLALLALLLFFNVIAMIAPPAAVSHARLARPRAVFHDTYVVIGGVRTPPFVAGGSIDFGPDPA